MCRAEILHSARGPRHNHPANFDDDRFRGFADSRSNFHFSVDLRCVPYKYLSYRRETALQGGLVMAMINGRLELGDNILRTL